MRLRLVGWPQVAGVFVGGCIARGEGSSFRAKAHAHNDPKYDNLGWICVRAAWRIGDYVLDSGPEFDGTITKPSELMMHELAHILTPKHGHDGAWMDKMHDLGQSVPQRYIHRRAVHRRR